MSINIDELRDQIAEKNMILISLKPNNENDTERKRIVDIELDRLLYLYFKSFKCACSDIIC